MQQTILKNTKLSIPPHLARPHLGDLQKVNRNIYVAKKDIDMRVSDEICILALPKTEINIINKSNSKVSVHESIGNEGNKTIKVDAEKSLTARIKAAVEGLDVNVKANWTADGKPQVKVVRGLVGDNSIGRKDITAALAL